MPMRRGQRACARSSEFARPRRSSTPSVPIGVTNRLHSLAACKPAAVEMPEKKLVGISGERAVRVDYKRRVTCGAVANVSGAHDDDGLRRSCDFAQAVERSGNRLLVDRRRADNVRRKRRFGKDDRDLTLRRASRVEAIIVSSDDGKSSRSCARSCSAATRMIRIMLASASRLEGHEPRLEKEVLPKGRYRLPSVCPKETVPL